MFTLTLKEIMAAAVILLIIGYNAWKEIKDYRKRKLYQLEANPERCHDHEVRLRTIEHDCGQIKTDIAVISTRLNSIDRRLDNIGKVIAGEHEV